MSGLERLCLACGLDADFIPALPTALMKPLSGSGARGLMIDTMNTFGADSFAGDWRQLSKGLQIRHFILSPCILVQWGLKIHVTQYLVD